MVKMRDKSYSWKANTLFTLTTISTLHDLTYNIHIK